MIYFLGDVHGRMDHTLRALEKQRGGTASVVLLGDIEAQRPFEEEIRPLIEAGVGVWFIHGNHDTDRLASWRNLQGANHRNLDGRVVRIEGIRIAGLGGIFRDEIWHPDRSPAARDKPAIRNYEQYLAMLKVKTAPALRGLADYTGKA